MVNIGIFKAILKNFIGIIALSLAVFTGPMAFAFNAQEAADLEKLVRKDPQDMASRRSLFQYYTQNQKWAKSAAVFQPVQAELSKNELMLLIRALIFAGDGKAAQGVLGYYHGKFQVSWMSKVFEGHAQLAIARKEPVQAKKIELATAGIGFYKDALRIDPQATEAYMAWIAALKEFWTQYHDDAIQVYKKMEEATKTKKPFLAEKCELYLDAKLWNEAIETCKQSTEMYPEKVDSYARMAVALQVQGDKEKAKAYLEKAAKRHAKSYLLQKSLGDLYAQESNFVQAAENYRAALEIDPKSEVYLSLASAEYQQKKYAEALIAFHYHCWLEKKLAREFVNATGQLRDNISLHNRYKAVMSSCQELKP